MRSRAALALLLVSASAALSAEAASAGGTRIDGPASSVLSEAEIAVDAANPRRVLVVSKDVSPQGFQSLDAFASADGGASFRGGPVVAGSYLGASADASDPVAVFDRAGTAFFGQLVWRYPGRSGFESIMGVQRSDDGGATFQPPVAVVRTGNVRTPLGFGEPPSRSLWHDKEWLAVDRSGGARDGDLYVAWVQVRTARRTQKNRIAASRSTDGGATFAQPRLISSKGRFALGPQVAVQPDGTVQVVWASFRRGDSEKWGSVLSASSRDGGQTFSTPRLVARFANGPAAYNLVALDASTSGSLLACWSEGSRSDSSGTVCARSPDGADWSRPVQVAASVAGSAHELVAVAAQGSQRFWVSFYTRAVLHSTVRLYRSDDGGRTFNLAKVLARRSYDLPGFVGDYSGLEVAGGRVFAAYVLPRGGRRSRNSIYVTSLAAPVL